MMRSLMMMMMMMLLVPAVSAVVTHESLGLPELVENYIGGEFVGSSGVRDNLNPATGGKIGRVVTSTEADVERAIAVAKKAQDVWGSYPVQVRARALERMAFEIEAAAETLARAESLDMGKVLASSAGDDVKRQARNLRYHAANAEMHRETSSLIETDNSFEERPGDDEQVSRTFLNYVTRYPVGVVGVIAHWSRTLHQAVWRIAPALACGNAVIVKAPSETPLSTFALAKLVVQKLEQDKVLPVGLVNFVFGEGKVVGSALARHRAIGAIAFVGGPEAAASVQKVAAEAVSMKKLKFDVGNNHALVVAPDADLDLLLPVAITAAFKCDAGQRAHSLGRLVIHKDVADTFLPRFIEAARALTIGDPLNVLVDVGPLVSKDQVLLMSQALLDLTKTGAKLLLGGLDNATLPPQNDPLLAKGNWFRPTIVGPFSYERSYDGKCPRGCGANDNGDYDYDQGKPWSDEHQGPIVKVVVVDSLEDLVHAANAGPFGLSASVWSSNLDTAHTLAHSLDVGYVWVNSWLPRDLAMPFGGWKESGNGQRSGGHWDLDFFSYTKTTNVELHANRHDLTNKNAYKQAK